MKTYDEPKLMMKESCSMLREESYEVSETVQAYHDSPDEECEEVQESCMIQGKVYNIGPMEQLEQIYETPSLQYSAHREKVQEPPILFKIHHFFLCV